ncbi:MAG: efflux RND transporter permease subunit [Thermaurantimonas sp.]|uniref:efflux RND transporter permease subunit n=1 Tax=Thermaurantimonas sp. TaxID=2681568 RepID=UPI0039187C55
MWDRLAVWIIRQPTLMSVLLAISLSFALYKADDVCMSYQFSRLLPTTDSVHIQYQWFKDHFSQVSNTIVIATATEHLRDSGFIQRWIALADKIRSIDGVTGVFTFQDALNVLKIPESGSFKIQKVFTAHHQHSTWPTILTDSLPFYRGVFTDSTHTATIAYIQLDPSKLYNAEIIRIINEIKAKVEQFESDSHLDVHISGIPFLRMGNVTQLKSEIYLFVALATLVTAFLFYLFLKSFKATVISLIIVAIGVVWSLALMAIFGFEITLLTSLIPPLVIVIGIPNCIFLINKFHYEFKKHKNRVLALQRTISKIGNAIFFSNLTTALGFFALAFTKSATLVEFGLVASISIVLIFIHSLIVITLYFLYAPVPKERHMQHFDRRWVNKWTGMLRKVVFNYRGWVFGVNILIVIVSIIGLVRIETSGRITDDLSRKSKTFTDLKFIEEKFNGIEPVEIIIDTGKKFGAKQYSSLQLLNEIQDSLKAFGISRSLSLADAASFATQAFYNGNSAMYRIPTRHESRFMARFLKNVEANNAQIAGTLYDSSERYLRIHFQVKDLTTLEMKKLKQKLSAMLSNVLIDRGLTGFITGAGVLFLEGTEYLVKNLLQSLSIAIALIAILMYYLFKSWKMVLISLITNLIPLIFTAGVMGFAGVPLKPSTLLVFGIAFGISVDDTIHFLAKYRQELQKTNWNIPESIRLAIHETGISMFYTSVILFCGFIIFIFSSFGGTVALGLLVSLTLLIAMLTNLFLLPSFALALHKHLADEDFENPPLSVVDPDDQTDDELSEKESITESK